MQPKANARAVHAEATGVDVKVRAKVVPNGGSRSRETSRRVAGMGYGPQTDSRKWPIKQRRLKRKAPKVPLAVCVSIGIF
jgi:hypothetical protein